MCISCWKLLRFVFLHISNLYYCPPYVEYLLTYKLRGVKFYQIFLRSYIPSTLMSVSREHVKLIVHFQFYFGVFYDLSWCDDPDFWASCLKVEAIIGRNDEAIMNFEKVNWKCTELKPLVRKSYEQVTRLYKHLLYSLFFLLSFFLQARLIDPNIMTYMDEYAILLKSKSDYIKLNKLVHDMLHIDPARPETCVALAAMWERKDERKALTYAEKVNTLWVWWKLTFHLMLLTMFSFSEPPSWWQAYNWLYYEGNTARYCLCNWIYIIMVIPLALQFAKH